MLLSIFVLTIVPAQTRAAWQVVHHAGGNALWGVATNEQSVVAVGTNGLVLVSQDGSHWTAEDSGTSAWLVGVAYGASSYVIVGDRGTILLSPDGKTWTPAQNQPVASRLNNVAFSNGRFVAVGEGGVILTSTDGQKWEKVASGVMGWLRGIAHANMMVGAPTYSTIGSERWWVCGQGGVILESADGRNWTSTASPVTTDIEVAGFAHASNVYFSSHTYTPGNDLFYVGSDYRVEFAGEGGQIFAGKATRQMTNPTIVSPLADFTVSSITTDRLRANVSTAGVTLVAGDDGTIYQRILDPYVNSGEYVSTDAGTRASFQAAVAFDDGILLVGTDGTIVRESGINASRLVNLSTRVAVGSGEAAPISGLSVHGTHGTLLRVVGPSLAKYGIKSALPTPFVRVFDATGKEIENSGTYDHAWDDYADHSEAKLGIGSYPANSGDLKMFMYLPEGAYTIQVSDANNAAGVALVETYEDVDGGGPAQYGVLRASINEPRMVNISTRGLVGSGERTLIGGFIIQGETRHEVLIRAIGPTLGKFGVSKPSLRPHLELHAADGTILASNQGWSVATVTGQKTVTAADIKEATPLAGAFPLDDGSADAAILMMLPPGGYTAVVTSDESEERIALVEVYEIKR